MATTQDVSKMSYAELQKLMQAAAEALNEKKVEEIKVLADGYMKKTAAAGFTPEEAIEACRPYLPQAGRATSTSVRKPYKKDPNKAAPKPGQKYVHPTTGEQWTRPASGKGRTIGWLQELHTAGHKFEEFEAK